MISYYDIRAARNAMKALQNKPLRHRKLDIHSSIPKVHQCRDCVQFKLVNAISFLALIFVYIFYWSLCLHLIFSCFFCFYFWFCPLQDNPSEKHVNHGTLVVFNIDASVSTDALHKIFGVYGEIKEVIGLLSIVVLTVTKDGTVPK